MQLKYCPKCEQDLPLADFASNPSRHDKLASHCRVCCRKLYKENRAARLQAKKEFWRKNKEVLTQKKAAFYQKTKDSVRLKRGSLEYRKKEREQRLFREHGVTAEEVTKMQSDQNNSCGICKNSFDGESYKMCTDHCHITGIVRGLLCGGCNSGIGYFRDNINTLEAAIAYLRRSS